MLPSRRTKIELSTWSLRAISLTAFAPSFLTLICGVVNMIIAKLDGQERILNSPAGARAKSLIERWGVSLLGASADPIVEKLSILADENAPFLCLYAIEDDGGGLGSRRRSAFAEAFFQFHNPCQDLIVGIAGDIQTLRGEHFAHGRSVDHRLAAPQN